MLVLSLTVIKIKNRVNGIKASLDRCGDCFGAINTRQAVSSDALKSDFYLSARANHKSLSGNLIDKQAKIWHITFV